MLVCFVYHQNESCHLTNMDLKILINLVLLAAVYYQAGELQNSRLVIFNVKGY